MMSDVADRDQTEKVQTTIGTVTVAELWERCSVVEPGIVLMCEPPNNTLHTYEVLLARSLELGSQFERFTLVVDLSDVTERPRGKYLQAIRRRSIDPLGTPGAAIHLATTQPGSAFLRTVLGFVLGRMSRRTSVHPTRDAAVAACRAALATSKGQEVGRDVR